MTAPHPCDEVPADPGDGQIFECARCGYTATYVVLDGVGEWVS